jgi:Na+/H+ antiporter NhaD/arsenite permease-like protein
MGPTLPHSIPVTAAAAALIFGATYVVIAIGKLPGFRLDRAGAALLGASLMVACGVLSPQEAFRAIDGGTIALLLGMMIVVANLRLSGFFRVATNWLAARARHPLILLTAIVLVSGVFSAVLVNDTICLAVAPLVLELATRLRRNPVPYLLAVAMASNCGGVATITGNPQNILIGSLSQIPYGAFAAALSPVAAIGLVLTVVLIALFHPREFWTRDRLEAAPQRTQVHTPLMIKSLLVTLALTLLFFAGAPPAGAAILAGAFLLLTRIVKSTKVYFEIDWPLLMMFAGLFIVVAGFEKALLSPHVVADVARLRLDRIPELSVVTAVLSNLVSNVPAVLVLRPFVLTLHDHRTAWLTVAMASTLAGNFTLLGSVANLIVAQKAAAKGVAIGFRDYFKIGAPLTVLTIVIGAFWLA